MAQPLQMKKRIKIWFMGLNGTSSDLYVREAVLPHSDPTVVLMAVLTGTLGV